MGECKHEFMPARNIRIHNAVVCVKCQKFADAIALEKRVKELEGELKDRTKIREITEKLRQQWDDYQALQAKVEDYENRVIPSWKREEKLWEAENEKLKAICENVGELLSTMEDAHLQTAWHILDNAGFTKNHKKAPPGE